MATVNTYYLGLEKALKMVESDYNNVLSASENYDEYAPVNYSQILFDLSKVKQRLVRMLNIHKFLRISKEAFLNNLQDKVEKIEIKHTVTEFDSPISIARKYNITLEELLQTNNLIAFNIAPGMILKIEQLNPVNVKTIFNDIPTYGSQEGELVFGKDIPDEITAGTDGDIRILEPRETLVQGILNRVTAVKGNYPGEDDFGIDDFAGTELPPDIRDNLVITKTLNQLGLDGRIEDVTGIEIVPESNGIRVYGNIIAVNGSQLNIKN